MTRMNDYNTALPRRLIGLASRVRPLWAGIVRIAIRRGSWSAAIDELETIDVDAFHGDIVIVGRDDQRKVEAFQAYEIMDSLRAKCYAESELSPGVVDRDLWYRRMRTLFDEGLGMFWFSLGVLGCGSTWFPRGDQSDAETSQLGHVTLSAMIRWWPEFMRCEPKFTLGPVRMPWPYWGSTVRLAGSLIGVPDTAVISINSVGASDVPRVMKEWIDEYG